jgi:hypothetical protein
LTLGVTIIVVALASLATIGLRTLLKSSPDAWASAIVAVATVVLVAVTSWYVYLTSGLLQAQRLGPRAAAWEESLRKLQQVMGQYQPSMTEMSEYTLDTSDWPDDRTLEALLSQVEQLTTISEHLLGFYGLLPIDFVSQLIEVGRYFAIAAGETRKLWQALADELLRALTEKPTRLPTWTGAQKSYGTSNEEPWDETLARKKFRDALELWGALYSNLSLHLMDD